MIQSLLGKKLDQTQAFLEDGRRIPLSIISVSGNYVSQLKNLEKDKYNAVQIAFGEKKKATKATLGHIKKAGLTKMPRFFVEIRVNSIDGIELGKNVDVSEILEAGDVINVTGVSKGKGYAGVVKRHHFKGGPRTHGQSDRERAPGSSGQTTTPGRVYKGKRMSGRMGSDTVTVKNLTVIDIKDGVLYVKGLVPGVKGGLVIISKAQENKITKALKKKFTPLFVEKVEISEPEIKQVEVEMLPENPEAVVEEQKSVTENEIKAAEEVKVEEKKEVEDAK